jgi:hypothetical protein
MNETLFNVTANVVTTDDYYTPKWLFDALRVQFDIDVAAPEHGIPWLPAKRWFSQANDGLAQEWGGEFVWMNPPFSKPGPWFDKFIENGNGIAVGVVSKSKWFAKMWAVSDVVVTMPPLVTFTRPDGSKKEISFQTFLFAIGEKGANALRQADIGRAR